MSTFQAGGLSLAVHPSRGGRERPKSLVSLLESFCLSLGWMVKNSWFFSKEKKMLKLLSYLQTFPFLIQNQTFV